MNSKDYKLIAGVIKNHLKEIEVIRAVEVKKHIDSGFLNGEGVRHEDIRASELSYLANSLGLKLKSENGNFNYTRFVKDCGL